MRTSITPQLQPGVHQEQWNLRSTSSNTGSSLPSPPADDPIDFDDSQPFSHDALLRATQRYDFPFSSSKASPTSSNEADADADEVLDWGLSPDRFDDEVRDILPDNKSPDWDAVSTLASSSYSDFSDINNRYSDVNSQKIDDTTIKPLHEKTT